MGQRQGIAILRQLFYAIVVVLLIYLPHGECNIRSKRADTFAATNGPLDTFVGSSKIRLWQVIAIAIGGILLIVIIISCFVKCRIPESQASRLQRLQQRQRRQDEIDHPLGRPVPENQSRPDSSYRQYDGPYHDTHQVNLQLIRYPPTDYSRHQSHPPQNDNRRQRESWNTQQPLPSRYSAPPDRFDHHPSMQQYRPPSNASRGR